MMKKKTNYLLHHQLLDLWLIPWWQVYHNDYYSGKKILTFNIKLFLKVLGGFLTKDSKKNQITLRWLQEKFTNSFDMCVRVGNALLNFLKRHPMSSFLGCLLNWVTRSSVNPSTATLFYFFQKRGIYYILAKTAPDKLSRTSYLVRKGPREYQNVPSIRQHSGDDGHSMCWKKCHFGLTQKKFVNEKKNAESWLYDPKATSKVCKYMYFWKHLSYVCFLNLLLYSTR